MKKNLKAGIITATIYFIATTILYMFVRVFDDSPASIIPSIVVIISSFPGIALVILGRAGELYHSTYLGMGMMVGINLIVYFLAGFLLSSLFNNIKN